MLTPEREKEITDYPVPLHIPHGWPWAQFRAELLAELDRLRADRDRLKTLVDFYESMHGEKTLAKAKIRGDK